MIRLIMLLLRLTVKSPNSFSPRLTGDNTHTCDKRMLKNRIQMPLKQKVLQDGKIVTVNIQLQHGFQLLAEHK